MKFNLLFLFLQFLTFSIVPEEGGGGDDDQDDTVTGGDDTATGSDENPVDAVLEELGLDEGGGDGADKDKPDGEQEAGKTAAVAGETDKDKVELTEEQKAAAAAAETAKGAITDADLAPLNSRNPDTNERFRKVTEGYKQEKERSSKLEVENTRYKESFDSLRQLGFQDESAAHDLVEFASYRHILATGDAEAFAKVVGTQIKQFEAMHGKRVTISASALDDHPELKAQVEALELDEGLAIEIAQKRNIEARATRDQQQRQQQQQTTNQSQEALNDAVAEVTALQNTWQATDPDFPAILPHLQPLLADIGKSYTPNLWAKTLELQYKSLKKALVESKTNSRGSNLPLRGNGHRQGQAAPSTPQEAVLQELGLDGE